MGYYVDLDSAEVADELWVSYGNTAAAGNTCSDTRPGVAKKPEKAPADESTEALCNVSVTAINS